MTGRFDVCKDSPTRTHDVEDVSRICRWCHRTVTHLQDYGWNVPYPDPDWIRQEDERIATAVYERIRTTE